jgi:hypothetical protein
VLLAAYEAWVTTEWQAIGAGSWPDGGRRRRAPSAIVEARARLPPTLARAPREPPRRSSRSTRTSGAVLPGAAPPPARLAARAPTAPASPPPRAADAQLLYTLERVCDAIAEGEARALGVDGRRRSSDGLVARWSARAAR